MKIIDRRRIGPLLLLMSFAVIGSLTIMLALSSFSGETSTAQAQQCLNNQDAADFLGVPSCADLTATAQAGDNGNGGNGGNGGDDVECLTNQDAADFLGVPSCANLTATAVANMTATAASIEATAQAKQTATAAAMTATAVADAAATAAAIADMTATAQAIASQTAEAKAQATAAAQAKRTATAAARMTATAVAQKTVTSGGVPPPQPKPSATPVNAQSVDVTMAVEGATTVEPDMSAELMAGNVTVKLPTLSRDRTYQAMLSESDDCGDMAMACAMVSIYDADGNMESDVRLISSAEIMVTLSAEAVSELGAGLDGGAVATQANALGGISLRLMSAGDEDWNTIPSSFMVNSDGSATVSGMTRRLSMIALHVDADMVEKARMQLSMALGTPTATPVPTSTPVPPPTATPVPPTPTPEPVVVIIPDTGEGSMPFLMLLAMAVGASALALVGTKLIMARTRR